jgi:hypothetical protein
MTNLASKAIGYAIWAVLLVPVAVGMLWFGFGEWSWRGFLTAFTILAIIGLTFEAFEGWVERRLRRRREARDASSSKPES